MSALDGDIARLLREATALKSSKNLSGAIERLRAAKQRMLVSEVTYPIETWCRLPKYLAAAGRQQEAAAEVEWLLGDLPRRLAKAYHVDNPQVTRPRSAKLRDAQAAARHPTKVLRALLTQVTSPTSRRG